MIQEVVEMILAARVLQEVVGMILASEVEEMPNWAEVGNSQLEEAFHLQAEEEVVVIGADVDAAVGEVAVDSVDVAAADAVVDDDGEEVISYWEVGLPYQPTGG